VNRILAQVLDWYVYTRFVAIRSREGKHFRHAGLAVAESRPIFAAVVLLLGSSITRTAATGPRVIICSLGGQSRGHN